MKLDNFSNAVLRLKEGVLKYNEADDLYRDGLVQRFEFTFELAWKTLKSVFEGEGLIGLTSPKTVLKEAFSAGLITDEELWLAMLTDRNLTSHVYNEKLSIEICNHIRVKYVNELNSLVQKIRNRIE